ncbi:hypothetical protein FDA94_25810 [Herbidospora galbida]|uniref:Uncharacterized protein n=1 Tax=Herbidospora galbida TaxID=2575442 RepID=A0A4U3MAG1_9ACTN|nr:hypothetical protein [Herbidospora galbida]TKK85332.1 hypothetical protein FDA94_25810 [Herbidospora galbida]
MIAFLAGASLAAPDDPLKGFQEWVSEKTLQKNSPIQWAYIIAESRMPGLVEQKVGINQIPPEIQELLVEDTVELVREFLTLKENKKE